MALENRVGKIRLCLDTSFMSHLDADDVPQKMQDTLELAEYMKAGMFEIVLPEVAFEEMKKCKQPKQDFMLDFVNEIEYIYLDVNETIRHIADEVTKAGLLKEKQRNDRLLIGCAVYSQSDYLVSWNIEDLANVDTVEGVRKISDLMGLYNIDIVTPTILIKYLKED
jgi:predicted nucleic acid-binding protein